MESPSMEASVTRSVILSSARTPIGKLSGAFASMTAMDLGGYAISAALERAGLGGDQIDYVLMGHVLQAGQGQITARQAAVKGGISMSTPANTINKVCLSGLNTLYLADQMIRSGDADVVIAGGMESMTNAPHLLQGARAGLRMGDATLLDSMINDGLWDSFDAMHMGSCTETSLTKIGNVSRESQDRFASQSHQRAAAAAAAGHYKEEIVPVSVAQRKGDPIVVEGDEGVRANTTVESLGALRAAFTPGGTLTAGNASQISDGGAAIVVASQEKAEQLGISPIAEILGFGMAAGPDNSLPFQASRAAKIALDRAGMSVGDVDLFEINEAFSAIVLASMSDLGVTDEIVNVNGGAVAVGHPIGMSGTRIALTLVNELRRRGGGVGVATLCGGGGQGDAAILRSL